MLRWPVALVVPVAMVVSVSGVQPPSVRWEPVPSGVSARLRGVSAVSADVAWVSGAQGTVLRTTDGGRSWQPRAVAGAEALDLRDIEGWDDRVAVAMSAGPGEASRIYRTIDGGATWTLAFTAREPGMFLDAMAFSDASHGVAFSDAVDARHVVFTTTDGGATWARVPAALVPAALPGEGAFAASGTNVAVQGRDRIWIGTTASRVLHSSDGGRTWSVAPTPLPTGEATGIFSVAFRDARHGVIVGGTYTKETAAVDNSATTADGGATWHRAARTGLSGFRSAVAALPALGPRAWLAVGPSGSDLSVDDGRTWAPSGGEGYDTVSIAPGGTTGFAAGSQGRVARITVAR
jgi:photosystem II stability/assembly factor-like uncharacterized protein